MTLFIGMHVATYGRYTRDTHVHVATHGRGSGARVLLVTVTLARVLLLTCPVPTPPRPLSRSNGSYGCQANFARGNRGGMVAAFS